MSIFFQRFCWHKENNIQTALHHVVTESLVLTGLASILGELVNRDGELRRLGWSRCELRGGEWLWKQGDEGVSLAWVEQGTLRVVVDDRERGTADAGSLVGEASVFTTNAVRTGSVQAIQDTIVWVMGVLGVDAVRHAAPEHYELLLEAALQTLVERVAENEAELTQRRRSAGQHASAPQSAPRVVDEPLPTCAELLSDLPQLADEDPSILNALSAISTRRSLAEGELLCREADAADALYVVASGELAVEIAVESGQLRVASALRGALLGTTALIPTAVRSASLRATCPTRVYVLERERVRSCERPVRVAMLRALVHILRDQLVRAHAAALSSRGARGTINLPDAIPALGWLHAWRQPEASEVSLTTLPPIGEPAPHAPELEAKLDLIRRSIIGGDVALEGPFGTKRLVYADYTASGRSLSFIEDFLRDQVMPLYANTHSESSESGRQTTHFREEARDIIKRSVGADERDALLFVGSGATGAVNKLLGIMNLRMPADLDAEYGFSAQIPAEQRPVVFVGPYEHHSNILPWRHSIADVQVVPINEDGAVDLDVLEQFLVETRDRPLRIGSFSAASNITGTRSDTIAVATLLHRHGALSFWDYAAAGPYVDIDMNPTGPGIDAELAYKDAIFTSPHKFIGGPGTPGVLVIKRELAKNLVPADPGGGTVDFVTFGETLYTADIEAREEGGTPAILESIRCGLVFQLKEQVGAPNIEALEHDFVSRAVESWKANPNIRIVGNPEIERLSITSLMIAHGSRYLHYGFVVALLNDLFGVQARGGCSCAGPYGAMLLGLSEADGEMFLDFAERGWMALKPGWARVNFNYFISETEFRYIVDAIHLVALHGWAMLPHYDFDPQSGHWSHRHAPAPAVRKLSDLHITDGAAGWGPSRLELSESVLGQQLEQATATLAAARASVRRDVPHIELPAEYDAARWFPVPVEVASSLGPDEEAS